ncbi:MAG: protoporphyrinogen oxidase, partial [Pirellulales bacterium]
MNSATTLARAAPRIAVIGGGITGLAAAHRITELVPHAELALFEASSRLGGVLDTVELDGFLIERSADNFLTKSPHALELCRRLGIAEQLLSTDETRRRAFVVRAGRLVPIPAGFFLMSPRKLWPLLASPALSLAGKLRLLAEPLIPRLKPSPAGRGQGEGDADESVASFARRRLGRETFERLVQPLVAGIYTADPEKLSMAATMPEFLAQERAHGSLLRLRFPSLPREGAPSLRTARFSDQSPNTVSGARYALFVAPKHGMATLVNTLANRIPPSSIRLNALVTSITPQPNARWQLNFNTQHPASRIQHPASSFDALIVSLPSHAAAGLLQASAPELSAELAAIEYAGCAVVSLGFQRRQIAHPLDGFGFVVPQVERRRIIAAS